MIQQVETVYKDPEQSEIDNTLLLREVEDQAFAEESLDAHSMRGDIEDCPVVGSLSPDARSFVVERVMQQESRAAEFKGMNLNDLIAKGKAKQAEAKSGPKDHDVAELVAEQVLHVSIKEPITPIHRDIEQDLAFRELAIHSIDVSEPELTILPPIHDEVVGHSDAQHGQDVVATVPIVREALVQDQDIEAPVHLVSVEEITVEQPDLRQHSELIERTTAPIELPTTPHEIVDNADELSVDVVDTQASTVDVLVEATAEPTTTGLYAGESFDMQSVDVEVPELPEISMDRAIDTLIQDYVTTASVEHDVQLIAEKPSLVVAVREVLVVFLEEVSATNELSPDALIEKFELFIEQSAAIEADGDIVQLLQACMVDQKLFHELITQIQDLRDYRDRLNRSGTSEFKFYKQVQADAPASHILQRLHDKVSQAIVRLAIA